MPDSDATYREALAEHHRHASRAGGLAALGWLPLILFWRARRARTTGDPWAWTAIALTALSSGVGAVTTYRRADLRAEEVLAREAAAREDQRRDLAGEPTGSILPPGLTPVGCLAWAGLFVGGWVRTAADYRHRPDRARRVVGPRWRIRPGPAWWTARSAQQLPVNAASTAPRGQQIAYERRQLLTSTSTGAAGTAVITWQQQLGPGITDRDWLRVTAGTLKIITPVVRGIADYRLVPTKVDAQRRRRRQHDAAVAALIAARAAGTGGPGNPWRADILVSAAATTAITVAAVAQFRVQKQRPKRPPQPTN